jgi:hypothetical protein
MQESAVRASTPITNGHCDECSAYLRVGLKRQINELRTVDDFVIHGSAVRA